MKVNEALKVIDGGWVRKPKGFRVHFQKYVNSDWVTEDLVNIYVVDDLGHPIKYYASNQFEVFNSRDAKKE